MSCLVSEVNPPGGLIRAVVCLPVTCPRHQPALGLSSAMPLFLGKQALRALGMVHDYMFHEKYIQISADAVSYPVKMYQIDINEKLNKTQLLCFS